MRIDVDACRAALKDFAGKRVLVVGDLMLDEHVWGKVRRISPEAPVMVVDVESPDSDFRPGGAANVANNITAFGASASMVGVVGDDEGGRTLVQQLADEGVDVDGILVDSGRPTIRKTRIWASHRHQVVRVDRESKVGISPDVSARILASIEKAAETADAILVSDYDKGVCSSAAVATVASIAGKQGKVSTSNAKPRNLPFFAGIDVITLNQFEASDASGIEAEDDAGVEAAGARILETAKCRSIVITRGGHGFSLVDATGAVHVPAVESEVYDGAGAGDTFITALTLALSSGLDLPAAGVVANCAGGAVVRKVGVATTSAEEIKTLLEGFARQQGM